MSHPVFTDEDRSFILTILSNPAELTSWLVYADWLEEHENALQAEFLRLMVRREQLTDATEWAEVEERLHELRAELPRVWVEVFDRPKIENCDAAFRFKCPQQWENLKVTGQPTVRHCDACDQDVHYCHTLPEARARASAGQCVAVRLGVPRHPDDLKPPEEVYVGPAMLPDDEPTGWPDFPFPVPTATPPPPPPRRPWWKFW